MREFFEGTADLFENVLFAPLDWLRELERESWFAANIFNWLFLLIGLAAFFYWMKQLKEINDRNEENRDPSAHSFLK